MLNWKCFRSYILSICQLFICKLYHIDDLGEVRATVSALVLLVIICIFCVRRGFAFLLVLWIGYMILLWCPWSFHILFLISSVTQTLGKILKKIPKD